MNIFPSVYQHNLRHAESGWSIRRSRHSPWYQGEHSNVNLRQPRVAPPARSATIAGTDGPSASLPVTPGRTGG